MQEIDHTLYSFEELHTYVHETLCASENLLREQFQTEHRELFAGEKLCGIEFSLHGLRSIRLGAIWAADQNRIYFYNARGERYLKVRLRERIPVDPHTAS